MGTPDFALPGLKSLIEDSYFDLIAVYTKADRPKGRKQQLASPPIKQLALEHGIPVFQPEKIKAETENIKALKPDLIVVIAYGKIIPQAILDIPTYGCINVHASLLPKYRGSACLNAPIINGDRETGITIMKMDAGMDTGAILRQKSIKLNESSNLEQVHDKLSNLAADTLPDTLKDFITGNIKAIPQDESQATYVTMTKKEDGHINWEESAEKIEKLIRGLNPWPGTFTHDINGKLIKILEAKLDLDDDNKGEIGQVYEKNKELAIHCGQNKLIILKLQTEGGKAMSSSQYLSGHQDIVGQILK